MKNDPVYIVYDDRERLAWVNGVEIRLDTLGEISFLEKVLMILGHKVLVDEKEM